MTIMSGVMYPLDTAVGVVIRRVSSRRTLMLPSLDATYPRAYMRRPISTISARSCSSTRVLIDPSRPERPPALFGTEVMRRTRGGQRQFLLRRHVGPTDRIPDQFHRPIGRTAARRIAAGAGDNPVHQSPERLRDHQKKDRQQQESDH